MTLLYSMQVFPLDEASECVHLLRHLAEVAVEAPMWRRQRPHLMIEAAMFEPSTKLGAEGAQSRGRGVLHLDAFVRSIPLSANQLVTVPGAGDFAIQQVAAAPTGGCTGAEGSAADAAMAVGSATSVLATPDDDRCAAACFWPGRADIASEYVMCVRESCQQNSVALYCWLGWLLVHASKVAPCAARGRFNQRVSYPHALTSSMQGAPRARERSRVHGRQRADVADGRRARPEPLRWRRCRSRTDPPCTRHVTVPGRVDR